MSQLYEERIFISIGHRDFQIPRSLFSSPGNSPNYFSLGFAVFFSTPTSVFPGLDRTNLLRPPSILPPSVPGRSADTFASLLHMLRGYNIAIRNEEHREELIRDCKYFHFKGLEQRLVRCEEGWNASRGRKEIVLRLEDVRQSGISVVPERTSSPPPPQYPNHDDPPPLIAFVNYARPYLSHPPLELILEIGDECTKLHFPPHLTPSTQPDAQKISVQAEFFNEGKARIARLFELIATKLNLPTSQPLGLLMKNGGVNTHPLSPGRAPISGGLVHVELGRECFVTLDGREWRLPSSSQTQHRAEFSESEVEGDGEPSRKRQRMETDAGRKREVGDKEEKEDTWIVKTGQWRLRVQQSAFMNPLTGKGGPEIVLVGVKIDAVREEWGRNRARGFLGS